MKSNFKKLFEDFGDKEINFENISKNSGVSENKTKILYFDDIIPSCFSIGELKDISDVLNVKLSQLISFEDDEEEESEEVSQMLKKRNHVKHYLSKDHENDIGKWEIDSKYEVNEKDAINPEHYQNGEIDLIESWSLIYPENEFIAGMEMIADRYVKRHRQKNGVQDLDKAIEYLERLKEYESDE